MQPAGVMVVSLYSVVAAGATVMELVVSPVLQIYETSSPVYIDESLTSFPGHTIVDGSAFTP